MVEPVTRVKGEITVHPIQENGFRARIVFEGAGFSVALKADQALELARALHEVACDA